MTQRALITGCAGFVGRRLWRCLTDNGWEVCGCDRLEALESPADGRRAEEVMPCDIADATQVERLVRSAGSLSHVFHLAAMTFVPEAARSPRAAFDVNLLGTVALADTLRTMSPQTRLLFVATSEVYGPPRYLPQDEEHPLCPGNPYAISKAAADQYCEYVHRAFGQDVVRVRPFNHSGPGQSSAFVLPSVARQIARIECEKQEPVLRVGNLDAARDFSHVDDVVRAYELAALDGVAGETYNVCSGRSWPLRVIVDMLVARARTRIAVEVDPARLRPVDIAEVRGCHRKITEVMGWVPQKSMEELLDDLLEYWRASERGSTFAG